MANLVFVDVEADGPAPTAGRMTEFGAVYTPKCWFYGGDDDEEVMASFAAWLAANVPGRPVFVSDNPAFDWQWINCAFWKAGIANPFGHSARRIGDYYAGLTGKFWNASRWKQHRKTPHDHNPVNDAMGNYEAFQKINEKYGGRA